MVIRCWYIIDSRIFDRASPRFVPFLMGAIIWTFLLLEEIDRVPESYLRHLEGTDGLYDIRVQIATDILEYSVFLTKTNWLF